MKPRQSIRKVLVGVWNAAREWNPDENVPEFHSGSDSEWNHEYIAQRKAARDKAVGRALRALRAGGMR